MGVEISFVKMHGAGNDFVVVEGDGYDWAALAPGLCGRRTGVGSDGLLVALPSTTGDVRMRMFNPDGTEDDCGNGLRCLALYALRRGMVRAPEFGVETLSGVSRVRVEDGGEAEARVTVWMPPARLAPEAIPARFEGDDALGVPLAVDGEVLTVCSLSTGTAHTVIFERPEDDRFERLSPLIEHHRVFPARTSIMWADVVGADRVRVRIWERGVGETLACGTGAAATAVAAHLSGRAGSCVDVQSKGGVLRVEVEEDLSLRLTGPARFVFEGTWTGDG